MLKYFSILMIAAKYRWKCMMTQYNPCGQYGVYGIARFNCINIGTLITFTQIVAENGLIRKGNRWIGHLAGWWLNLVRCDRGLRRLLTTGVKEQKKGRGLPNSRLQLSSDAQWSLQGSPETRLGWVRSSKTHALLGWTGAMADRRDDESCFLRADLRLECLVYGRHYVSPRKPCKLNNRNLLDNDCLIWFFTWT